MSNKQAIALAALQGAACTKGLVPTKQGFFYET